jgi:hypothetical protein
VPGARTKEEFLFGLRTGQAVAGGRHGSYFTMASDIFRFADSFYRERAWDVAQRPLDWRSHASLFGGVLGLPLIGVALAEAYLHFVAEERFNRNLLFDLIARPARAVAAVPDLAA